MSKWNDTNITAKEKARTAEQGLFFLQERELAQEHQHEHQHSRETGERDFSEGGVAD